MRETPDSVTTKVEWFKFTASQKRDATTTTTEVVRTSVPYRTRDESEE